MSRAAPIAASMAIGRPEASADALHWSRSAAEDGEGGTFLAIARNGGDPGSPRDLSRGVVPARGRKFRSAVAAEAIEASAVLRPDQAIRGGVGAPRGADPGHRWRLSEPAIKRRAPPDVVSAAPARTRDEAFRIDKTSDKAGPVRAV